MKGKILFCATLVLTAGLGVAGEQLRFLDVTLRREGPCAVSAHSLDGKPLWAAQGVPIT